jgi:hypothetical protein
MESGIIAVREFESSTVLALFHAAARRARRFAALATANLFAGYKHISPISGTANSFAGYKHRRSLGRINSPFLILSVRQVPENNGVS